MLALDAAYGLTMVVLHAVLLGEVNHNENRGVGGSLAARGNWTLAHDGGCFPTALPDSGPADQSLGQSLRQGKTLDWCKERCEADYACSYLLYMPTMANPPLAPSSGCAWYAASMDGCATPTNRCFDKGVDKTVEYQCKVYKLNSAPNGGGHWFLQFMDLDMSWGHRLVGFD